MHNANKGQNTTDLEVKLPSGTACESYQDEKIHQDRPSALMGLSASYHILARQAIVTAGDLCLGGYDSYSR